jgi:hypothetical protein
MSDTKARGPGVMSSNSRVSSIRRSLVSQGLPPLSVSLHREIIKPRYWATAFMNMSVGAVFLPAQGHMSRLLVKSLCSPLGHIPVPEGD